MKQYPALALRAIEELGRRLREAQETIKSMAVERSDSDQKTLRVSETLRVFCDTSIVQIVQE